MGIFTKKIRDYKIMQKYRKRLDDFYVFGVTQKYLLYLDKEYKQYILRQDRQNPKDVVYLGWLRGNICIFCGKIFFINNWSYVGRTENPLNYIDIETGTAGYLSVLSNKGFWCAMHRHCQDVVKKFYVQDNQMVLEVERYKENSHNEVEFTYVLYIICDRGEFKVKYVYPEGEILHQEYTKKQQTKIGDTITVNILDPLGGRSQEEVFLDGCDTGSGVLKEQWTLREDLWEVYQRLADEENGELYVVICCKAGEKNVLYVPKEIWEKGRHTYYNS